MTESVLKNPLVYRQLILYEFRQNTPIFEAFKKLTDFLGNDFMIYPEFEFWWMRYAQGKFDLDYDRSQDRTPLEISDLPIKVFKHVVENLDNRHRYRLRLMRKSFKDTTDSWTPKFKVISVWLRNDDIELSIDEIKKELHTDRAMDTVFSILGNPKLQLGCFAIRSEEVGGLHVQFHERLTRLKHKINSESVSICYEGLMENINYLKYFHPGVLKNVNITNTGDEREIRHLNADDIAEIMNKMNQSEQCQKAEEIAFGNFMAEADTEFMVPRLFRCQKIALHYTDLEETAEALKEALLDPSSHWTHCQVFDYSDELKEVLRRHPTVIRAGNRLVCHIPDSDEQFVIDIQEEDVLFKRKQIK